MGWELRGHWGWRARRLFVGLVAVAVAASAAVVAGAPPAGSLGAQSFGSLGGLALNQPIVGMAPTPTGDGYWLVARDGGVFAFGDAGFYGSTGAFRLRRPIVGIAATPRGEGYWLVASDGGIFAFGDARFYGSTGGLALRRPIVGMAATRTGRGYWLVASDGGVFTFGDARFYGSAGGLQLRHPIVDIARTRTGRGYWLVASDGGVFTFGDARFYGSTGGLALRQPIVGIAPSIFSSGYWLVARDGGVFNFGGADFHGSLGTLSLRAPVVAAANAIDGNGYWMVASDGGVFALGGASGQALRPRRTASRQTPIEVLITGDSMVVSLQGGLDQRLRATGGALAIGKGRWGYGLTAAWTAAQPCLVCPALGVYRPSIVSEDVSVDDPDAYLFMVGAWDRVTRVVQGKRLAPDTPEWLAWYRRLQDDAVRRATAGGALVYWLGYPACEGAGDVVTELRINDLARAAAARNPTRAAFLDLHAAICPGGPVRADLPLDGKAFTMFDATGHFTAKGAQWTGRWIAQQLAPVFGFPAPS
jgi:hypothetical protein